MALFAMNSPTALTRLVLIGSRQVRLHKHFPLKMNACAGLKATRLRIQFFCIVETNRYAHSYIWQLLGPSITKIAAPVCLAIHDTLARLQRGVPVRLFGRLYRRHPNPVWGMVILRAMCLFDVAFQLAQREAGPDYAFDQAHIPIYAAGMQRYIEEKR